MSIRIRKPGKSSLIGFLIPVGSRYEPNTIKGISHFLEHMIFKGTKKRNYMQIPKELEQYGANFNAFTSEEYTVYYAEISNKYVDEIKEVFSDMLLNSILPEKEFEKERNVILQEYQMYVDNPQTAIYDISNKYLYNQKSGLHIPTIGTFDSIQNITRKDMIDFYKDHYSDPTEINVGGKKSDILFDFEYQTPSFSQESYNYNKKDLYVKRQGISQANILYTGVIDLSDNKLSNAVSLKLLDSCLNGFAGRLFTSIREENNLVYHVSFAYQMFSCGTVQYSVYAALDPKKIPLAKHLIIEELTRDYSDFEIDFAIRKYIGNNDLNSRDLLSNAKKAIFCSINNIPYDLYTSNIKNNLIKAKKHLNDFKDRIDFKNTGKLIALIPE